MKCFNSSDPAAVNATVLYDFNEDNENLWIRSSLSDTLPPCFSSSSSSFSPSPPNYNCLVCLNQVVYAVCQNLTDGVKMTMEAGGTPVNLMKSDCPKPPSVDDHLAVIVVVVVIVVAAAIVFGVLVFKNRRRCRNVSQKGWCSQRQETTENKEESKEMLRANGTP